MTTAIVIDRHGGPDVLTVADIADPEPGPTDLLVEIAAAGVNFIDTYHRSGLYEVVLPFVPGLEGAGVVTSVGSDVDGFAVGDRIAWSGAGRCYASQVVVPVAVALAVPSGVDLELAAAVPLQGMTAHYLACDAAHLKPGDRCLVHAAAGGTGRLLVQIAKMRGAEVVATVGSEEKAELARSAGADHVVNYRDADLVDGVEALVGPDAIDVVFDGVGAAAFDDSLQLLRTRGSMVTYGNASGPVPPVAPLRLMDKSLWLTRPKLWDYVSGRAELEARAADLFGWILAGEMEVRVGLRLPLSEAAEAHRRLESRETTGKVLLLP
ncbi:MAG: quinone oxidoreductase [Acidimicrobiales bacterium]